MGHVLEWSVVLLLACAAAWAFARLWRVLAIGAAYKARILCSTIFGVGRAVDPSQADEVGADSYSRLRLFRARVNAEQRSVTAAFLGLRPRTAIHRPGLGSTLLAPATPTSGRSGEFPTTATSGTFTAAGSSETAHRSSPTGTPEPPWPLGAPSTRLEALVEAAFTEPDPRRQRRTRAIIVVHEGRTIAERYAPGFTATTPFPGWSMTKSVLSALIGVLVGEGRLSLADRELLPQWRAPDPRGDIRLEDLLRMRSGLKFSEVYSDLSSDVIEMLFNRADAADYAASRPLRARPGTVWSYSSGTTNILSSIARRAVGEADYLEWPRRMLFDPIGMRSAIMEVDAAGTFVGSSFMLATARDWARFGVLYLQDGLWGRRRILPEGWVRFSTSPTPQSPEGSYGAHWWLKLQPEMGGGTPAAARIARDAFFTVGHEGQTLTVVPSLRLVVVRLGLSIYIDAWNHASFLTSLQDAL